MNIETEENLLESGLVESYKKAKILYGIENTATEPASADRVILPYEVKDGERYFVEDVSEVKDKPVFSFFKRAFDLSASFVALCVLILPILFIALLVVCTSKGHAFYKQERLGLKGKKFNIIKFRTMVVDAEKDGAKWSEGDNDERITRFGKFLRKTRLDELPQLFCCFIGTMSLVGPRPERKIYYIEFEKYIHGFCQRLKVKPGLTGYAQVNGGYNLKPEEKVVYDVEYIKKRSMWLDLKIIFKTIGVVFCKKDAK